MTKNSETHQCCNERLAREGGKATCCDCDPHEGCTLGERLPEISKTFKPLEYYREKYTQQQLDEAIADARRKVIEKVEKLDCTCDEGCDYSRAISDVLATLRKEERL